MISKSTYVGKRFGKLTVISSDGKEKGSCYVNCKCDCGNIVKHVKTEYLKRGTKKSCGCIQKSRMEYGILIKDNIHLYYVWKKMNQRCSNPNNKKWKDYGGRGIKVCEEWKNDFSSFCFWSLKNGYAKGLSIDRIDNNGDYEPSNCRWATMKTQIRNRRTTLKATINGVTKSCAEWCEINGIPYRMFEERRKKGWSLEMACHQIWSRFC